MLVSYEFIASHETVGLRIGFQQRTNAQDWEIGTYLGLVIPVCILPKPPVDHSQAFGPFTSLGLLFAQKSMFPIQGNLLDEASTVKSASSIFTLA
jgi:hypothetical protein